MSILRGFFNVFRNRSRSKQTIFESPKQQRVLRGALSYFNAKRGFGFIKADDMPKDVFVHCTDMKEYIKKGDEVRFEINKTEKGWRAKNVVRAETA